MKNTKNNQPNTEENKHKHEVKDQQRVLTWLLITVAVVMCLLFAALVLRVVTVRWNSSHEQLQLSLHQASGGIRRG